MQNAVQHIMSSDHQTLVQMVLELQFENARLKKELELQDVIKSLKADLKPVIGFFNEPIEQIPTTKKRISKKEKLRLEAEQEKLDIENHKKMLEQESLNRLKNKGSAK